MDQSAKFEEVRVPLVEPARGLDSVSGVLGIPEWWPTGDRVALALAHDAGSSCHDPLIEYLHRSFTQQRILTIRFNFPFAEKSRRAKPDSMDVLEHTYRCALSVLGRDPTATPAHLILAGVGLGARVAAKLASERLQIAGLVMLSYPLHPAGKPEILQTDGLNRIISPMLFVHGSDDPTCQPTALRRCLSRIGAPTTPYEIPGAGAKLVAASDLPPPPPPPRDDEGPTFDDEGHAAPRHPSASDGPPGPGERLSDNIVHWIDRLIDNL